MALFLGACTSTKPGEACIVSEYLPRGTVEQMLHDPKIEMSLYSRISMAIDVALGMSWLHGPETKILHRDLKTSNLLVDASGRVKICDFGLSQVFRKDVVLKDGEFAKGTVREFHFLIISFSLLNVLIGEAQIYF